MDDEEGGDPRILPEGENDGGGNADENKLLPSIPPAFARKRLLLISAAEIKTSHKRKNSESLESNPEK